MLQTSKAQLFAYLLLLLAGQLCFCLVNLMVSRVIDRAELIGGVITIGFSKCIL